MNISIENITPAELVTLLTQIGASHLEAPINKTEMKIENVIPSVGYIPVEPEVIEKNDKVVALNSLIADVNASKNDTELNKEKVMLRDLTRSQIAPILGVSVSCVGQYVKDGMPHDKINDKCYKYNADECLKWQKENRNACSLRGKKYGPRDKKVKQNVSEFQAWKRGVEMKIKKAGKDVGKTESLAFKRMTKVYGVVWDQVAKEFKEANGYRPHSTIQAAHWYQNSKVGNECRQNLFDCCLDAVLKEIA